MMLDKDLHDWALMYMVRLGHKNLNTLCAELMKAYSDYPATCMWLHRLWKKRPHTSEMGAGNGYIVANGGDSRWRFSIIGGSAYVGVLHQL